MIKPIEGPYIKGSSTDPAVNPDWRAAQDFQINRKNPTMTDTDLSPEQQVRLRIAEAYIMAAGGDFVQPRPMSYYILAMSDCVMRGDLALEVPE